MPVISLIIPVYNIEQFLPTSLESILAQTFTDWECIIVDDGSTDGTPAICDRYAENDHRFRVTHIQHQGVSEARNVGLSLARGQYIGFVDGDDYIHPEMYRILYEQIKMNHADLVCCQYTRSHQQKITFPDLPTIIKQHSLNREQLIRYSFRLVDGVDMGIMCNKLFSKNIIGNERFSKLDIFEDMDFNYRIYLKCTCVHFLDLVLYNWYYREGSNTLSHKDHLENSLLKIKILLNLEKRFNSMTERELGYYYSFLMKLILVCKIEAKKQHIKNSLINSYYSQYKEKFYKNSTIPFYVKFVAGSLWLFPQLYHIYSFIIYHPRFFKYKNAISKYLT